MEVGLVLLREAGPAHGVRLVVLEDAARGVERHVHAQRVRRVRHVQRADHVRPQRLHLVRLAPVNVGPAGTEGRHETER